MQIIPAMDIIDGRCVRLIQGDYSRKTEYDTDPLEVARQLERAGIRRLHMVDLEGARTGTIVNDAVLKRISDHTDLQIDFGGGIKSDGSIALAFNSGAHQVTAGSIAVHHKALVLKWLDKYGAEKIILGADVRNGKIAVHGWQEDSGIGLFEFLEEYRETGIRYVICTDVSRDGRLQGPSLDLYKQITDRFPGIRLIASGGVACVEDLKKLRDTGVFGTIVGKAFYEGKISLEELASPGD